MTAPAELTLAEVGARWPDALVMWDRDVASQGWTPVFRDAPIPGLPDLKVSAFDPDCAHATGAHEGAATRWAPCRCVTWTGEAWVTLPAACYEAVRAVLRGKRYPLDARGRRLLWFMVELGCAAEITPRGFIIPDLISGRSDDFEPSLALGILSDLLGGRAVPETGHLIRQIPSTVPVRPEPGAVQGEGTPDARYLRIDEVAGRIVLRIRSSEAILAEQGPDVPVVVPPRFVATDRVCPYCGRVPERYRVLRDGSEICLACGRSMPAPVPG